MKDLLCTKFQEYVDEVLIRHKSILDILTKLQESTSKINRAVVKSVTSCGCISVKASKQKIPKDVSYKDIKNYMDSHLRGQICDNCKEKIEKEIGNNLFYLAALCNNLGIDLNDVISKECKQIKTLGEFSLF